jgi:hypothetical protein
MAAAACGTPGRPRTITPACNGALWIIETQIAMKIYSCSEHFFQKPLSFVADFRRLMQATKCDTNRQNLSKCSRSPQDPVPEVPSPAFPGRFLKASSGTAQMNCGRRRRSPSSLTATNERRCDGRRNRVCRFAASAEPAGAECTLPEPLFRPGLPAQIPNRKSLRHRFFRPLLGHGCLVELCSGP